MFRSTRKSSGRSIKLGVQALEAREVPAILIPPTEVPVFILPPPDLAGGTPETARVVTLPAMKDVAVSDYLPSAADVDMYRVTLKQGDFLAAEVESNGSVSPSASVQLLNAAGSQVATSTGHPITGGLFQSQPRLGAYAPADGTYYVRVTTSATTMNNDRAYTLNLERIGLDYNMAPEPLAASGAFHAWLNAAGDTLHLTGPTGYGFSLRGNWTKAIDGSTISYSTTGTIYLRTPFLAQTAGEVALQVPARDTFKITTQTNGFDQQGELTGVSGKFGLSLAPVADEVRKVFGLDVSNVALAAGWTIKTGEQIRQDYQSYVQNDIAQLLDGVPYLVYGKAGSMKWNFGGVSVTSNNQAKLVLIADPADPFLYVGYKNYAAAGSLNGHIPFRAAVAPSAGMPAFASDVSYGHVYAAGTYPLAGLPFYINGEVTVDLDANNDGLFLAGTGNASQLYRGDLKALDAVARDVNVGANGGFNFGYAVAGRTITIPLGAASVYYSGPQGGVWFHGQDGSAYNPWKGTALESFRAGPGAEIEGYIYRDGRFSVSTTSNFRLFTANAALTIAVNNTGIKAKGEIVTPIGSAEVNGSIGFDGNFNWVRPGRIDLGGSKNYIRGDATLTIDKSGGKFTATVVLSADGRMEVGSFKAQGKVTGTLKYVRSASGAVSYSGDLDFDGGVYVRNPVTHDWNKLGNVDVGLPVVGKKLKLSALGHTFTLGLPG